MVILKTVHPRHLRPGQVPGGARPGHEIPEADRGVFKQQVIFNLSVSQRMDHPVPSATPTRAASNWCAWSRVWRGRWTAYWPY